MISPQGGRAVAQVGNHLYTVDIPEVGGPTPTVSIANPGSAPVQMRKLTEIGGVPTPPPLNDPNAAQFRLFDAFSTFMRTAGEMTPLVLVVDDLHWADKPSLLLLQHFARELAGMRILLVGTFRDPGVVP